MISSSHTQTHVLMRKQVEKLFGIRSRCVAVVHFNWADTINKQSLSLSLSILVPSSHFLSSRQFSQNCREDFSEQAPEQ